MLQTETLMAANTVPSPVRSPKRKTGAPLPGRRFHHSYTKPKPLRGIHLFGLGQQRVKGIARFRAAQLVTEHRVPQRA